MNDLSTAEHTLGLATLFLMFYYYGVSRGRRRP